VIGGNYPSIMMEIIAYRACPISINYRQDTGILTSLESFVIFVGLLVAIQGFISFYLGEPYPMVNFDEAYSNWSVWLRYAVALALFLIGLSLRFTILSGQHGLIFVTFYPAIIIGFTSAELGLEYCWYFYREWQANTSLSTLFRRFPRT